MYQWHTYNADLSNCLTRVIQEGGVGGVSKLVFYAQSTGTDISGRFGGGGGGRGEAEANKCECIPPANKGPQDTMLEYSSSIIIWRGHSAE